MAPQLNIAQSELIPPKVEHGAVEPQDAISRDAGRRRNRGGQTVEDRS